MDELKLLERMLIQREQGELQDYRGDLEEERSGRKSGRGGRSWDGVVQGCLDQLRCRKTEDVIGLVWEPTSRSSFAYMRQRCAMQVVMERKGDKFLRRLVKEQRNTQGSDLSWLDAHNVDAAQVEIGLFSAGAWRMEEQRDAPGKDSKRADGRDRAKGPKGASKGAARREPLVTGASNTAYGHMETWISDRARAREQDGLYRVSVEQLDVHTQVQIRSRHDPAWSPIEEFEDHYGGEHDTSFATYDGVLLHENQHVEERIEVFNKYLPWFRDQVAHIEAETEQEALEKYEEAYEAFERRVDSEYFTIGEVPARALEWEFYHALYEKETGAHGVSRGAARSAGAAQGKKETARQAEGMTMMALASERPGGFRSVKPHGASGGVGVQKGGVPRRAALVFGSSADPSGRSRGDDGGALRPRVVALLQDAQLRRSGADATLRFGGTRPVFAVGTQARVAGAKVGVTVAERAAWAMPPKGSGALPRAAGQSTDAAAWVLRWWSRGADDSELDEDQQPKN